MKKSDENANFSIKYDFNAKDFNGFEVDFNNLHYEIVYGSCNKGGFFSVLNYGVSGYLSEPDNISINAEKIGIAIRNYEAGKEIARSIKIYDMLKGNKS